MGKSIDLSGKKFNRLTVIKCVGRNNSGGKLWLCSITYKGVTKNIKQWSIITGISYGCLLSRIHRGWNVNDALEQPVKNRS